MREHQDMPHINAANDAQPCLGFASKIKALEFGTGIMSESNA